MIGVEEAQARLLALASPLPAIEVSVSRAVGHYLAEDVVAKRTQPAADLSAMDSGLRICPAHGALSAKARRDGHLQGVSTKPKLCGYSPVRMCPMALTAY
jgi:MoeA N-terminal region (domain I and II)